MSYLKFLFLFLLFSCAAGHSVMTAQLFQEISIGELSTDLIKIAGKPNSVENVGHNEKIYIYIESIFMGQRLIEQRHYAFIIKDNRVESKSSKIETMPLFQQPNSFELQQTSQQ